MTLPELLADEALRQSEFPVARDAAFLAHAAVSPLPHRVADAIQRYATRCTAGDQEAAVPEQELHETRALAARLLGAEPGEIALVGPTSLGLSLVAAGLPWRRGENLLVYFEDYPSNVYPWMALADRGVEVRFIPAKSLGRIRPADVLGQVDEQTRLVALASAHFISGYRADLGAIGTQLHQRDILFCVDAIQTLGAFPTRVDHVDFLAADAHKWLLGPCAAGVLYVRRALQGRLQPAVFGWHNVACPNYVAQEQLKFRPDARRYEAGSQNLLGVVGLRAALSLLLEVGIDAIAAELARKRQLLVAGFTARGYQVLEAGAPAAQAASIVSAWRPDTDLAALWQRLEADRIITSLRADRSGRRYLRVAPHFYNTDAELERLLSRL